MIFRDYIICNNKVELISLLFHKECYSKVLHRKYPQENSGKLKRKEGSYSLSKCGSLYRILFITEARPDSVLDGATKSAISLSSS